MSYVSEIKDSVKDGFLRNHYGTTEHVAVLFDSVSNNQCFFYATNKISQFLQKRSDICFEIYNIAGDRPVIWPQAAIYPMHKIINYKGPVIATSLATLDVIMNGNYEAKYFYAYNVPELELLNPEIVARINGEVTVFTRTDSYRQHIQERFGIRCHEQTVTDFNVDQLLKVMKGKNSGKSTRTSKRTDSTQKRS